MAERLAYLEAVVGADITQFRKGMRDIRNETGVLSEVTRGVAGLGRTLTFAYTTPLLVLGTTALQTATEFEASMRNINSIAGMSEGALADLTAQTLEFGKTTRSGAIASSEALYTVFSAGIMDTADAFNLMNQAVRTSEAGLADLDTTTNSMIAVMLSYGDTSAEMASRTSDTITRMVQVGVGSMDAFASAIGGLIPAASAAGMEMEEWGANMAFLTQRGLSPAQGAISLNAILKKLISPTEAMSAAFGELGARNLPELIDEFGSVNEVIEALIDNADGDLTKLYAMFNTTQGQRGISQFVAGADAWQQAQMDFNDAVEGATGRAWEQQMMSFAATWDLLKSSVEALGIVIGQSMMPILQPLIGLVTDFVNSVSGANPELIGMSVAFIAVSAAIPPLLWLLGSLITPFGLIIGGAAALAVAFETNFGGIKDTVIANVSGIMAELDPLITGLENFWNTLFGEHIDLETSSLAPDQPLVLDAWDYITVTEPKSLWQVYEDGGYADRFSWNAFMEEALAGGWQGGAVTPDTPIQIGADMEFSAAGQSNAFGVGSITGNALGELQTIDEAIGNEARTLNPFERAMEAYGGQVISELQRLFTGAVDWVTNTGVPYLSKALGWLGGTIAQLIFVGTGNAINYVFSGQSAPAVAGIKSFLLNNIVTPFSNGVEEAIGGTALGTAMDTVTGFIDGLAEEFEFGEIDLSGFTALTDGFKSAFDDLAAADWSGVAKLGVILGMIGGAVFSTALGVLNSIGAGLGFIVRAFGSGLASLVNAFALAGNGDFEGGIAKFGQALIDFGFALLQIPVGIIQTLLDNIVGLTGLELPDIGAWLENLQTQIDTGIDEWINGRDTDILNAGEFFKWEFRDSNVSTITNYLSDRIDDGIGTITQDWAGNPVDLVIPTNFTFTNATTDAMQLLNDIIADADTTDAMRLLATRTREEFIAEMAEMGITIPPEAFTLSTGEPIVINGVTVEVPNPTMVVTGTPIMPAPPPLGHTAEATLPIDWTFGMGGMGVDIPTELPVYEPLVIQPLSGISLAMTDEIMSGASAQEIIDNNFIPIETYWTAMFAPEGTMAINFANFSTDAAAGWTLIEDSLLAFQDTVNLATPEITSTIGLAGAEWGRSLDPFIGKVDKAIGNTKELMDVIKKMLTLKGMVNVDVKIYSTGLDGTHKSGLSNVPFDGYVAELHKGERVLTADENKDYGRVPMTAMEAGTSSTTDNSNVTNNFYGIQDVDAILFEFKRRGIKFEK